MRYSALLAGLLVGVLTAAAPSVAHAEETPTAGRALWASGLYVFSVSYVLTGAGTTAIVSIANAREATIAESWIPLAGPWIMLADSKGFDSGQVAATTAAGIVQTLSFGAFVTGLVLVSRPHNRTETSFLIAPMTPRGGAGLTLVGTF